MKEFHGAISAQTSKQKTRGFLEFFVHKKLYCAAQSLRCILWGKRDGWWILRLKWLLG
jgi:hypothetical protein